MTPSLLAYCEPRRWEFSFGNKYKSEGAISREYRGWGRISNPHSVAAVMTTCTSKMHLSPRWLRLLSVLRRWFCCCWLLFIVAPIVGVCNYSMFCCTLLDVHSSIAIILIKKRELVALLNLSSWCLVIFKRLFLAVSWGCLRFVIVVFPDHTHLLFLWCVGQVHCPARAKHRQSVFLASFLQFPGVAV